jgi:hypothetical protein
LEDGVALGFGDETDGDGAGFFGGLGYRGEREGESGEEGGRSGGFSGEGWMYASDGVTAEELASMNAGDEFTSPFDFAMARSAAVASKKAKKEKLSKLYMEILKLKLVILIGNNPI